MSPVLCRARLGGGSLCLQRTQGCAAFFYGVGKARLELAGCGAVPWGRSNSYPSPALSFKEGDAGQICTACIPGPTPLLGRS